MTDWLNLFTTLPAGCRTANPATCAPPPHPLEGAAPWVFYVVDGAAILGALLALVTIWVTWRVLLYLRWPGVRPPERLLTLMAVLTFLWAVLPPLWFWCEYWFLYAAQGNGSPEAFAQFKHNQSLSAAIWAGLLAATAVILNRALAREVRIQKVDDQKGTRFDLYGSFSANPLSDSAPLVLLWSGDDASEAEARLRDAMLQAPFSHLHQMSRYGDGRIEIQSCARSARRGTL